MLIVSFVIYSLSTAISYITNEQFSYIHLENFNNSPPLLKINTKQFMIVFGFSENLLNQKNLEAPYLDISLIYRHNERNSTTGKLIKKKYPLKLIQCTP